MLTFKSLFENNRFEITHLADFCIVSSDTTNQYVLFRSGASDMNCYSLDYCQEVTIQDLMFIYNIATESDSQDEYVIENIINKERLLSYLFGLVDVSASERQEYKIYDELYTVMDKEELAIPLKTDEKVPRIINIAKWENGNFSYLSNCANGYFRSKDLYDKAVIAWNPEALKDYSNNSKQKATNYIITLSTNTQLLRLPFNGNHTEFDVLYSSLAEAQEAMRFIVEAIYLKGINLSLYSNHTMLEVIIPLEPDQEILEWIQLISDIIKKVRNLHYDQKRSDLQYIKQKKQSIQGRNFLYLSLIKSVPLIIYLCESCIRKYDLKINLIKY